eukprot:6204162-Pleurochrysis_carterae.AAC.4
MQTVQARYIVPAALKHYRYCSSRTRALGPYIQGTAQNLDTHQQLDDKQLAFIMYKPAVTSDLSIAIYHAQTSSNIAAFGLPRANSFKEEDSKFLHYMPAHPDSCFDLEFGYYLPPKNLSDQVRPSRNHED